MIEFVVTAWEVGGDEFQEKQVIQDHTTAQKVFDRFVVKYEADIAVGDVSIQLTARKPQ